MTNLEKYKDKICDAQSNGPALACTLNRLRDRLCNGGKCIDCVRDSLDWLLEEADVTDWSKVKQGSPVRLVKDDEKVGYFVAQYGNSIVVDVEEFSDEHIYDSWGANGVYAEEGE